jgi:hypothetical protein
MRRGLRFRPPGVEYTPEMRWALLRAFGPLERGVSLAIEPEAAIGVAKSLDLSPRIATRTPLSTLQAELGEGGARSLLITRDRKSTRLNSSHW